MRRIRLRGRPRKVPLNYCITTSEAVTDTFRCGLGRHKGTIYYLKRNNMFYAFTQMISCPRFLYVMHSLFDLKIATLFKLHFLACSFIHKNQVYHGYLFTDFDSGAPSSL
jgi:hypothetical protein